MQLLTRGKIISVLLEDCEIGSLRIESLIPVNTKMGGPITTLFMPMSAEGFVLSDGEDYFLVDGGGGGDILRCMDQMKINSTCMI